MRIAMIIIQFPLATTLNNAANATDTATVDAEPGPGIFINSTLHIPAAKTYDPIDDCTTPTIKSIFYRYIITLEEPHIIIGVVTLLIGALIYLSLIINLMIFSYSHQKKQNELLVHLTDIATELEGITSKIRLQNSSANNSVRRRRPVSFAALPSMTFGPSSSSGFYSTKAPLIKTHLKPRSKSMATILEV